MSLTDADLTGLEAAIVAYEDTDQPPNCGCEYDSGPRVAHYCQGHDPDRLIDQLPALIAEVRRLRLNLMAIGADKAADATYLRNLALAALNGQGVM
jgi:hypothetical protein